MQYFDDPQLKLLVGSKDENVQPEAMPNVPDNYVFDLQHDLNALGYAAGKADGWFGNRTGKAVIRFQQDAGKTSRQEQRSALNPGKQFEEDPPMYTGRATGIVDQITAMEVQRWKNKRWQRPSRTTAFEVEDIRTSLPINPNRTPCIRRPSEVEYLVLHCTDASPSWTAFDCARYDVNPNHISQKGCPTITYTYFVNADGSIQKCLSHDVVSWHAGDWNVRSLGVALAYRATENPNPPPIEQLEAASELFARLCQTFGLRSEVNIKGHRELYGTGHRIDEQGNIVYRKSCPGHKVDLNEFRRETARRLTT